jgi:class 3 adenylate cyclase/tetratricopeptide (TPR) repeat protein
VTGTDVDIGAWLRAIGLGDYEGAFRENAIDSEVLPDLTAEDLKEIGVVSVGHRRKILSAISRLEDPASELAPVSAISVPRRDSPGERRHVAVLFADLVGYTRLTEELGAEAMHALLDSFFSRVDAIIEREGGRVDKHIGDCVMGVFGAPVAHGNDAQRAVTAAIEIRKAVADLSSESGQYVNVHVGVTTGVVVASYVGAGQAAEYTVTGESVNLASRLADAAGAGDILISDPLHRMLESRLVCDPAAALSVKGFAQPVPAWRVLELIGAPAHRRPLVGQRNELHQFDTLLRTCREDGRGQIMILRGEAGIGKTRLGEEFETMAQARGFGCHRGLVLDFGAEGGRDAVRAIVRDLLRIGSHPGADVLEQAATDAVSRGIVSSELQVHLNDLLDARQPERLRTFYDAMDNERREQGREAVLAQIIGWAAATRPRLLIIEDVHWAKSPLLRALAQMGQAVSDRRAMLLMTTRVEGDPFDRSWRASVSGTSIVTMDLGPLRIEEARTFCQASTDDPEIIDAIVSRAGGNPLFLEQLLQHSGHEASDVPGTVQSLVQAAVDRLPSVERKAIQHASVIGQRVDPDLVRHLTDGQRFDPDRLVARGLLRPQGEGFLFAHALVRDAIYSSLLSPVRIALHRRAADWYSGRDRRLHAEHLALANAPEAPAAFTEAAWEEHGKYHYETALSLIERGLSLARSGKDRTSLLSLRGDVLHDFGNMEAARQSYAAALEQAEDAAERCNALIGLAAVERVTDQLDSALEHLDVAEKAATGSHLVAELSRLHFLRGNILFPRGELDRCLREHQEGLRFARSANRPDLEAASLGGIGDAEYMRGRMASARARLEECVNLSAELGLGRIEVANQAQVAHTLIYTAAQETAYRAANDAIALAIRVGHSRAEINARAAAVKALFALARHQECLDEIARLEDCIERLGAQRFRQLAFVFVGRALDALGRTNEAIEKFEEGLEFAHVTGFAFHGPAIASGFAATVRDPARRIELMAEAENGIAAGCVGHNQFRVYADGIDVAYALADPEKLRRYVGLLEGYPEGETVAWSTFHVWRGKALLNFLEDGATAKARTAFHRALEQSDELGMRFWQPIAAAG